MRVLTLQEVEFVAGGGKGEKPGKGEKLSKAEKLIAKFENATSAKKADKAFAALEKLCAKGDEDVCEYLESL